MGWQGEPTASSKVTGTTQWQELRVKVLERDRYQCQIRGETCTGHATHVDKIQAAAHGGDPFNRRNLQAACANCNSQKGRQEAAATRRDLRLSAHHPGTREPHPGMGATPPPGV